MTHDDLIAEIDSYCASARIAPSTLTVRALGNSKYYDRLKRRIERDDEFAAKLRAYMQDNPPQSGLQSGAA